MKNLKQLMEERGDIQRTLNQLTNDRASKSQELVALNKKETFTDEDQVNYDSLKNEIKTLDAKLSRNEEVLANLDVDITNVKRNPPVNTEETFRFNDTGSGPDGEEKELQKFSFINAIRMASSGQKSGLEYELSQEGRREAQMSGVELSNGNSIVIPHAVLSKKKIRNSATTVTAGTAGARTIQTESIDFVTLLRERLVLSQLGARFVTGLTGNIPLNNQATGFVFGWAATENAAAVQSDATFDGRTLSPKRGTGYMDVSNQWMIQTSPEIESALIDDILNGTRVGIEKAAISGSGSTGVPRGILNTTGIGAVFANGAATNAVNANGAVQAYDDWVNLQKAVQLANADVANMAYLTNPKVMAQAKLTKIDSGSGVFIWDKMVAQNERIGVANTVPSNLEKGNSSVLSPLLYGNFADLISIPQRFD